MKRWWIFAMFVMIITFLIGMNALKNYLPDITTTDLSEQQFGERITAIHPDHITETNDGTLSFRYENTVYKTSLKPNQNSGYEIAAKHNVKYSYVELVDAGAIFMKALTIFVIIGIVLAIILYLRSRSGNGSAKFISQTKNEKTERPNVSFDQIGGLQDETKKQILKSLELFKNAKVAKKMNLKPVKHMLFYGPPGTGKTQIAKAIAHELNMPFFAKSGSSFVELYVGVGAARVRELFEEAKKHAPSVIFIDEIDALAAKRGSANRSDECDRTLNELLVHMNGVQESDNILIVGATNRLGTLDEAILRPGRFDHKICIDLPDSKGRKEIMEIHAKDKPFHPNVQKELLSFAASMDGFSGADIEGLIERAGEHALIEKRTTITREDMDYALDYAILGAKRRPLENELLKKRIAFHEAGHALIQSLVKRGKIRKTTILPRGQALGFMASIPEEIPLSTEDEMFQQLLITLAGGMAEKIVFGKHSNGVGGDLEQAKRIISAMVQSGMGRNSFELLFSEDDQNQLKQELFQKGVEKTEKLLTQHKDTLEKLTDALLQFETLTGESIDSLVHDGISPQVQVEEEHAGYVKGEANKEKYKRRFNQRTT